MQIQNPINRSRLLYGWNGRSVRNTLRNTSLGALFLYSITGDANANTPVLQGDEYTPVGFKKFDREVSDFHLPIADSGTAQDHGNAEQIFPSGQFQTIVYPENDAVSPSIDANSKLLTGPAESTDRSGTEERDAFEAGRPLYRAPKWKDVRELEFAFQVLNFVDAVQTIDCLNRSICSEANPIMGRHPSTGRVILVKASAGVFHYAVTRYFLKKHPEWVDEWLITTVVVQGGVVMWNLQHRF
jgi:Domain of unknown function (DUF5658)